VRATFYKRPDLSLSEALERFNDNFVPLRNIQVFPLLSTFPPLARDFAALARERIVALYQVAEQVSSAPPAPPAPIVEAAPNGQLEAAPEEELLG